MAKAVQGGAIAGEKSTFLILHLKESNLNQGGMKGISHSMGKQWVWVGMLF